MTSTGLLQTVVPSYGNRCGMHSGCTPTMQMLSYYKATCSLSNRAEIIFAERQKACQSRPECMTSTWSTTISCESQSGSSQTASWSKIPPLLTWNATRKQGFSFRSRELFYKDRLLHFHYRTLASQNSIDLETDGGSTSFSESSKNEIEEQKIHSDVPSARSETGEIRNQLSSLESYFNKLSGNAEKSTHLSSPKIKDGHEAETPNVVNSQLAEPTSPSVEASIASAMKGMDMPTELKSLVEKIDAGIRKSKGIDDSDTEEVRLEDLMRKLEASSESNDIDLDSEELAAFDATSDSYMVYILIALNIAVFIFGLASPVQTLDMGSSTLPVLFGAKVNHLIVEGEWWRLITSMFLHSGFFHISLSTWGLLAFGRQVEGVYGPLAFTMIYFLGGLFGDILSFFHMADVTVGGSGPIFAIMSSWLVYLFQNRDMNSEGSIDLVIQLSIQAALPLLCFSLFLPVDNWIHLGGVGAGILFGSLACPKARFNVKESNLQSDNLEGNVVICDGPSNARLMVIFLAFLSLCFIAFNLLGPVATDFQLYHS